MKDRLFVLKPGFTDQGETWFCPYSAQVIGYLAYYPHVRDTLEVIELDFPKPRHPLVELVGEDHQSMPCLVLAEGGFVGKTIEILRHLAKTRGTPMPH